MQIIGFLEKLQKWSLYLLFFLFPIFFFPFTSNFLYYPKQLLTFILVFLSLISWLIKKTIEGKFVFKKNFIFYLSLFLIFLSFFLSFLFSLWPRVSFWGFPFDIGDSLFSLILFLILAFLLVNSFENENNFIFSFFFLIFGTFFAALFNLLQIYKIFIIPFDFTRLQFFNTVGSQSAFSLFLIAILPLSFILTFKAKSYLKILLIIFNTLFFLNILLINFKTGWFILVLAILLLSLFLLEKIRTSWLLLFFLMVALIISIVFYLLPFNPHFFPSLPPEFFLTLPSQVHILKGAFGQGTKNIILGEGPATFVFDYSKYRSVLLNQNFFWGTRFFNGQSTVLDWLLTKGIFGFLSLILLYFSIFYSAKNILEKKEESQKLWEIKLGILAGIFSLVVASLFYPFNFSLYFIFWFFVGAFFFFASPKKASWELLTPRRMIFFNFSMMVIIIFFIAFSFLFLQQFLAEFNYLKSVKALKEGKLNLAINYLEEKSIKLNPFVDIYWRDLAHLYLAKINFIINNKNLNDEEKRKEIDSAIIKGGTAIEEAVKKAPMNVANWNVRGFFYRNLIGLLEGAAEISLRSYQKAIELEPASPYSYGEKARVYILVAQEFSKKGKKEMEQQYLDLAEKELLKIIRDKKPDYAPALYFLAVVYDQKKDTDKAIAKLEETKIVSPRDLGVFFQLGLLYWRKDEIEKAEAEFKRTLELNPNYSNALYMLGLLYDKKGEKELAKENFRKVAELNPENEEIKRILENLEKNLPALEGIISSQPPIKEEPREIQSP